MKQKTKGYPNIYETVEEASMRLSDTVVMYDDNPYYILCIEDHKDDGIFRVYLDPLSEYGVLESHEKRVPHTYYQDSSSAPTRGEMMDNYLEDNPSTKLVRKHINSPKFNRFRPFPLGMVNEEGSAGFTYRNPTRYSQQGLRPNMVNCHGVSLTGFSPFSFNFLSGATYRMIKGIYPEVDNCLSDISDSSLDKKSVAFNRDFAFLRGPVNTYYLFFKNSVVGYLPSFDTVNLPKEYWFLAEEVNDTGIFSNINKV